MSEGSTNEQEQWKKREEEVRSNLEKAGVALQTEVLSHVSVYHSLDDVIGRELAVALDQQFSGSEKYSTAGIKKTARKLSEFHPGSVVREVQAGHEKFLVRRSSSGDSERVDIFACPNSRFFPPSEIKYLHFLFVDGKTKKVADLMDLKMKGVTCSYSLTGDENSFDWDDSKINVAENSYNGPPRPSKTAQIFGHEAGHSYQPLEQVEKEVIKNENLIASERILSFVRSAFGGLKFWDRSRFSQEHELAIIKSIQERNATAFCLNAVRKYRSLGVDIVPNTTKSDLVYGMEDGLRSYDLEYSESPLPFSKNRKIS